MSDEDYDRKLDELDRLLNDPDVSMEPARIWSLLAELSLRDGATPVSRGDAIGSMSLHAAAE